MSDQPPGPPGLINIKPVTDPAQVQAAFQDAEKMLAAGGVKLPQNRAEDYVKVSTLHQLQELHQDENLFLSLACLFAGAALGVIVNWVTSDSGSLGKAGWVALILFSIVTLTFTGIWRRAHAKAAAIKKRISEAEQSP
jgi:hypothetical protein